MFRGQRTKDHPDRRHILQTVISVRKVIQWTFFVDDSNARFLCFHFNTVDFIQTIFNVVMKLERALDGCLCMKLCWERNLEQNVFHHIGVQWLG